MTTRIRAKITRGSAELAILTLLGEQPLYGFQIAKRIEDISHQIGQLEKLAGPSDTMKAQIGALRSERDMLLAAIYDLEGMRRQIDADSLAFLSVEGLYRAMGEARRDPVRPQFTDHCFTGEYPTPLTDQTGQEPSPRQLSLLAEAS